MRKVLALLALCLLVSPAFAEEPLKEVKWGHIASTAFYWDVYAARELGFMKNEKLDVQAIRIDSASQSIPQVLAGATIDPSVSVPTASGASPAATPAADPELEPDGLRSSAYGLAVWPPSVDQPLVEWVDRKLAHSDRFALPMMIAPASFSFCAMNASLGVLPASAQEPAVVGIPVVSMLSLTMIGIPSSGL